MEKNLKELLLKDLCARLPYGVKCYFEKDGGKAPIHTVTIGLLADVVNRDDVICQPYLRPMSRTVTTGVQSRFLKTPRITYSLPQPVCIRSMSE